MTSLRGETSTVIKHEIFEAVFTTTRLVEMLQRAGFAVSPPTNALGKNLRLVLDAGEHLAWIEVYTSDGWVVLERQEIKDVKSGQYL